MIGFQTVQLYLSAALREQQALRVLSTVKVVALPEEHLIVRTVEIDCFENGEGFAIAEIAPLCESNKD